MKIKQKRLFKKISFYLINKKNDEKENLIVMRLFKKMMKIFILKNSTSQTSTTAKIIRAFTSSLKTTLLIINKRLTRIKQQRIEMTKFKKIQNYAQAATTFYQWAALFQSASSKKIFKSKSSKKILLKSRKIKKLIIQIFDFKKKEDLMKIEEIH